MKNTTTFKVKVELTEDEYQVAQNKLTKRTAAVKSVKRQGSQLVTFKKKNAAGNQTFVVSQFKKHEAAQLRRKAHELEIANENKQARKTIDKKKSPPSLIQTRLNLVTKNHAKESKK